MGKKKKRTKKYNPLKTFFSKIKVLSIRWDEGDQALFSNMNEALTYEALKYPLNWIIVFRVKCRPPSGDEYYEDNEIVLYDTIFDELRSDPTFYLDNMKDIKSRVNVKHIVAEGWKAKPLGESDKRRLKDEAEGYRA